MLGNVPREVHLRRRNGGNAELIDISIVGAGPTGLFAAFYAGLRGASVQVIDSLEEAGGQCSAMYPEKYIYDVETAGMPSLLTYL